MKNLACTVPTAKSFDEAVAAVEQSTAAHGFRVLHVHDMAGILAEKGFPREPLKIVEICNAKYSSDLLQKEVTAALMLPCPIVVYQQDGQTQGSLKMWRVAQVSTTTNLGAPGLAFETWEGCEPHHRLSSSRLHILARMTRGLHRYQQSGNFHFITFSCYQRRPYLGRASARNLFESALERIRKRYHFVVLGHVIMPEHVHLLVSEPKKGTLDRAIQALKLSVSVRSRHRPFWHPAITTSTSGIRRRLRRSCATCTETR